MDNLMLEKLKELLSKNDNIGICLGKNPGIDEMAAALSLYLVLTDAGKKVTVACPTQPIVEVSSLVGIDKVKNNFGVEGNGDLTVSFPYKEGEIEKISYTLENGKLNILVKAGEDGLSFDQKDIEYIRSVGAPKLVFVVGTPRISDLGRVFDPENLKDSQIVNIDYKVDNQGFGDLPIIAKNLSSASELIANIISSLGLKIDADAASNLMSGIVSATDNFQSPKTSPAAFEMAAYLLKNGAARPTNNIQKAQEIPSEDAYSFFKPQPKTPSFAKSIVGTEEKKEKINPPAGRGEDNPPDDWLAPKIYKGSTSI